MYSGITNQRETVVAWDRITGKPLHNAIVWLDKRNEEIVENLIKDSGKINLVTNGLDLGKDSYREQTGLPIATYFSGTKMRWMLDNSEEVKKAETEGKLCFGTIDSWLTY